MRYKVYNTYDRTKLFFVNLRMVQCFNTIALTAYGFKEHHSIKTVVSRRYNLNEFITGIALIIGFDFAFKNLIIKLWNFFEEDIIYGMKTFLSYLHRFKKS
jgi:hypothetical protein